MVCGPLATVAVLTWRTHLRTYGSWRLTLMRNVASSIGISLVISQLTQGTRHTYAILSQHINPFNHAMQMPDVRGIIDMATDKGRAMADVMVNLQAQIIAFSHDYQMVMIFTACAIPLAIMIGSTKAALRKQAVAPEHAVIEERLARIISPGPAWPASSTTCRLWRGPRRTAGSWWAPRLDLSSTG